MENILKKEITENGAYGEIEVQISPVGTCTGSTTKGEPIRENLTKEALATLADKLNSEDEVLVDVDHRSTKPGNEKDTKATGWLSNFYTTVKGMFARLRFTRHGRELVDNREYRHLSPVFALDDEGYPVDLHSVGMTNTPALKMEPILNSESSEDETIQTKEETIKMDMTKDELVELIKSTIMSINSAPVETPSETVVQNSEPVQDEKEEEKEDENKECDTCENACAEDEDEKKVKNEEPETEVVEKTSETVEEKKDEEEEKKEEVIKIEALNSAPTPGLGDDIKGSTAWKNLHGEEFFKWVKDHGNEI